MVMVWIIYWRNVETPAPQLGNQEVDDVRVRVGLQMKNVDIKGGSLPSYGLCSHTPRLGSVVTVTYNYFS